MNATFRTQGRAPSYAGEGPREQGRRGRKLLYGSSSTLGSRLVWDCAIWISANWLIKGLLLTPPLPIDPKLTHKTRLILPIDHHLGNRALQSPRNTKGPPEGAEGGTNAWPRPWLIARFFLGGGGYGKPCARQERYRVTGIPGHHHTLT